MAATTEEIIVKFRTEGGREVEETFRRIGDASDKTVDQVKKHSKANDDFLESQRRVRRNISELAQSFASGTSATDLFQQSVSRLAEVFKLGLGPGIAAGVGVALYAGLQKSYQESVNLHEEIEDVANYKGEFRSLESIESHLDLIKQKRDTLLRLREAPGQILGGIGLDIWSRLSFGFPTGSLQNQLGNRTGYLESQRKQDAEDLKALRQSEIQDVATIARTEAQITDIAKQRFSGSSLEAQLEENKVKFLLQQADAFEKLNKPGGYAELSKVLDELAAQFTISNEEATEGDRLRRLGLQHASDLAEITKAGLTTEQSLSSTLDLELRYRQRILDTAKGEQIAIAGVQLAQAQANAQTQITAQIRSRGADVGTGSIAFQNQSIGRQIEEANARAEARAERGQLLFESQRRALTPYEQQRLNASGNIIGNEESERLEEERRGLIRQQAQAQQILENNRDVARGGGGIGLEGGREFQNRALRLAEIDARLNQISQNRLLGRNTEAGTSEGDQLRSDLRMLINTLNQLPAKVGLN